MSDIRFNQWLHNSGTGGVSQVDGGHVGIGTTNPLIPVGSGVTAVLNVGVVTANYYYGDGSNLSGIVGGGTSLAFNDNIGAYFGDSQDLKIHHDGNHSYIDDQGTGNLRLRSGTLEILNLAGNKTSAIFSSGGGQTLNFNNSTKLVTTNTGVDVTGKFVSDSVEIHGTSNGNEQLVLSGADSPFIRFREGSTNKAFIQWNQGGFIHLYNSETSKDLRIGGQGAEVLDNIKFTAGSSQDLQLYHNGTHSYVDEVANGNLVLRTNPSGTYSTLVLQSGRENSIICNKLGSVELFHIGGVGSSTKKLETTSTGITISGGGELKLDSTSGGPYLLFHNRGTGTTDNSGVYNMGGISAAGYRDVANPSIVGSIQFERQPTSGGASSGCDIVFRTGFNGTTSHTNHSEKLRLSYTGHLTPGANNQYDLGSTAKGWRNVYMNDLNLSNINGDTNDVDGTQGSWTIQEGKDDLYIINRLNGKKFKIKMEEIS